MSIYYLILERGHLIQALRIPTGKDKTEPFPRQQAEQEKEMGQSQKHQTLLGNDEQRQKTKVKELGRSRVFVLGNL